MRCLNCNVVFFQSQSYQGRYDMGGWRYAFDHLQLQFLRSEVDLFFQFVQFLLNPIDDFTDLVTALQCSPGVGKRCGRHIGRLLPPFRDNRDLRRNSEEEVELCFLCVEAMPAIVVPAAWSFIHSIL